MKPEWDIPSLLLCFFHTPSFSYIRAPPWDRRTHWLKDVTIATREKKQKKKRKATQWGGRSGEYSEMERDTEGVNNLKTERKSLIWRAGRWRGRERASDGGERQQVFLSLSGSRHTGQNTDRLRSWTNRRCQPPTPSLSPSLSLSLCVFHTLSIHMCSQR